ncbi:amidase [Halomonas sp. 3H]|uniref:amidase n=1 Tax=Halomonas sp. 3H TaxID=2952527 RepID=UPI0020B848B1|nr:amidase [Halomonas sp. 3H]
MSDRREDDTHLRDAIGLADSWFGLDLSSSDCGHQSSALRSWHDQLDHAWQAPWPLSEPSDFAVVMAQRAHPQDVTPDGTGPSERVRPEPAYTRPEFGLTAAAEAMRRGEVSATELTIDSLKRLDTIGRDLNAVIAVDEEAALVAARCADRRRQAGQADSPLLGIPLAHKALYGRAGRESTSGAAARRGFVPNATATVLERLDAAGAVDLGQLHTTEAALDPSGLECHIGPCRNPWDETVITGGSSSGSAVAVACGAVFGSLGSDTGGSVRIPAALCGVTGIKPTYGRVSRHGVLPVSFSCDHVGVLGRTAGDCALLLEAIAGHDPRDATSSKHPMGSALAVGGCVSLAGRRIGVPEGFFRDYLHHDAQALLDDSLKALRELGADLVPVPHFDYDELNALAAVTLQAEAATVHLTSLQTRPHAYSRAIRRRLQLGLGIPAVAYNQAIGLRGLRLAEFLDQVMAYVDMLHTPVIAMPTPSITWQAGKPSIDRADMAALTRLTRPFNYLGLPAITLPCGFMRSPAGKPIPVGFQLVGHPFSELELAAAGAAYQSATDWHRHQP